MATAAALSDRVRKAMGNPGVFSSVAVKAWGFTPWVKALPFEIFLCAD